MPLNNDLQYLNQTLQNAVNDFLNGNYARGFSSLREVAKIDPQHSAQVEKAEARYFYMLRFIGSDNAMPDFRAAMGEIFDSVEDILVRIALSLEARRDNGALSPLLRYAALRPEETLESLVSDYLSEAERLRTDTAVLTDTRRRATLERIASDIFNRIRISIPLGDDTALLENIITDTSLPAYDRVMWTAAVGLNINSYLTRPGLDLLLHLHATDDDDISTAAAVWLVIAMDASMNGFLPRHNRSMAARHIADVAVAIEAAHPGDADTVLREWVRTLDTDRLTRWFLSEIKPRLNDMGRRFSQKMKENPEAAQDAMNNPDFITGDDNANFEALKQFSEAQHKGADVFMPTLGQLRSFPFFATTANWFLPFHTDHSALSEVVDSEGAAIADTVASMPMMCDSDKFALILSMAATPAAMRAQAFEAMTSQLYAAADMPEFREMMEQGAVRSRQSRIADIVRNLYRVSRRLTADGGFRDLLAGAPSTVTASTFSSGTEAYMVLADSIFDAGSYSAAAEYYSVGSGSDSSPEHRLRHAISLEKSGDTAAAAAIFEAILDGQPDNYTAAMHLAKIHLDGNKPEAALAALSPFLETHTDDLAFLRLIASAYMAAGRWDEAVSAWHNIDYLLPGDDFSAKGDLAWALTLAGDCESAAPVFEQAEPTPENMQRRAVMLWLTGRRSDAVGLWRKSHAGVDTPTVLDTTAGKWLVLQLRGASLPLLREMDYYNSFGSPFGPLP